MHNAYACTSTCVCVTVGERLACGYLRAWITSPTLLNMTAFLFKSQQMWHIFSSHLTIRDSFRKLSAKEYTRQKTGKEP